MSQIQGDETVLYRTLYVRDLWVQLPVTRLTDSNL